MILVGITVVTSPGTSCHWLWETIKQVYVSQEIEYRYYMYMYRWDNIPVCYIYMYCQQ